MIVSGQTSVSAGAITQTVSIPSSVTVPTTAYQATTGTSWMTDVSVSAKTRTGFTATFAVSAPTGGGTLDWLITL